ncbi:MAG: protein serine/threonine phosphatase [Bacteroidetes bacterium]|nr:protein serine/threonine phosphatase [Bacteroidota bacterium]
MRTALISFLLTFALSLFGQRTDSLRQALKKADHDTTRCILLNAMIEEESDDNVWPAYNIELRTICEKRLKTVPPNTALHNFFQRYYAISLNNDGYLANNLGDDSTALKNYFRSLKIDEQIRNHSGMAGTLNNIASLYASRGNSTKALVYHMKSLRLHEETNNKHGKAVSLNNIGLIYKHLGDIPKSLEYYHLSLGTMEELHDKAGMATLLNNMASIYKEQGESKKAFEYYDRILKMYREIDDKDGIAMCMNSIGSFHTQAGDYSRALNYHKESAKLFQEIGHLRGVATSLNSIGLIYKKLGENESALDYLQKSLKIYEQTNNKLGVAFTLSSIAHVMLESGQTEKAKTFGEKSLRLAKELGFPETIKSSSNILSMIYSKTNNWKEAYEMHVLFKHMSDSVNNENNRKSSLLKSFQYTYGKKAAADSVKAVEERKVFDARIQQEKTQQMALYVVIGLVLIFSVFMYNRFRLTNKQKRIIELQKTIVEEKQKEVLDSIRYAKRIQNALLPRESYIQKTIQKIKKGNSI